MSISKEEGKKMDFGACCSMMAGLFKSGSKEEGTGGFDLEDCKQMMKQFCPSKDEKDDLESCRSMMAKCFEEPKKE